jgi:hypothetical protein
MDPTPTPWPDPERGTGVVDRYSSAADPVARPVLARYAACVAGKSPERAADLLTQDFHATAYESGMRNLSRYNEGCARDAGLKYAKMRLDTLPFAGGLAEALIARRNQPVNALLVRAAAMPPAATFSFTDRVAMCVVRSAPDQVAALFASQVASAGENAAIAAAAPAAELCARAAQAKKALSISPTALRAMLATAAYRSIAATEGGN